MFWRLRRLDKEHEKSIARKRCQIQTTEFNKSFTKELILSKVFFIPNILIFAVSFQSKLTNE